MTARSRTLTAALAAGVIAGAVGGMLSALATFWLLILGGFFGGPRPSPSAWSWRGLLFAQLYAPVFMAVGAAIGGVLGLLVGALAARRVDCPPAPGQRRMLAAMTTLLGIGAMLVFEFVGLRTGGLWMTTSFALGGLVGGLIGTRLWLRLWTAGCPGRAGARDTGSDN